MIGRYVQLLLRFFGGRKLIFLALACVVGVIAVASFMRWQASNLSPNGMWVRAELSSLERPIIADGPLSEGSGVVVVAPFEGTIKQRWVEPGDHVDAGARLFELDATELQSQLREARAADIRAQEDLLDLLHWQMSQGVTAAQRQVVSSQNQMQTVEKRFDETQNLFDKGIVARTELQSVQAELLSSKEQFQSAKDGLETVLRKGSKPYQDIAKLEAQSRRIKLRTLQERLKNATITAPVAGVALRPTQTEDAAVKNLNVGSFVANRAVLMIVGNDTNYLVRAALDEFDAARVKPGLPVEVTLSTDEKAVMVGELTRVSAQARTEQRFGPGGGTPMFDIEVLIRKVPQELRGRLRLGMTTRVRLLVDKQPAVLSVPLTAIRLGSDGRAFVTRRADKDLSSAGIEALIEPGSTLADRAVVLKGLSVGDSVWVPTSATLGPVQSPQMSGAPTTASNALPSSISQQ